MTEDPDHGYVLGHAEREMRRLAAQARMVDPITARFFRAAGVGAGMRVLDVGCGAGDVTVLVAGLVGESGQVIGVDRSADAVATATGRAAARGLPNVSFLQGDPAQMSFDAPFDAVVGRYVLQFQHDPGEMLRGLVRSVRPGGLIAFHELDWGGVRSVPPVPTSDRCCVWLAETLRLSGTEGHMGAVLHSAFVAAGLAPPTMQLEALLGCGAGAPPMARLAELAATLLPAAQRLGASAPDDLDVDMVLARMRSEADATDSLVVGHFEVGAWSHRAG